MMLAICIFAAIGMFFTLTVIYLIIDDVVWSRRNRRMWREIDAANAREEREWREGKREEKLDRLWREIDDEEHTRVGRRKS